MPTTCWAPGCKSGYRTKQNQSAEERHFFNAPKDHVRLLAWKKGIPRAGELTSKHHLCDLHFEERFILKKYSYVINGQTVEMDRGTWKLTDNAVPSIFPNVPKYLSTTIPKSRQRRVTAAVSVIK